MCVIFATAPDSVKFAFVRNGAYPRLTVRVGLNTLDRPLLASGRWVAWEKNNETYEITWLHDSGGRGLRSFFEHV